MRAKELDEQLKSKSPDAVGSIVGGANKTVLNQIAQDFKKIDGFSLMSSKNASGQSIIGILTMRAGDLTPANQLALANTLIHDRNVGSRSTNIEDLLAGMNPKDKNNLFKQLMKQGDVPKMFANFDHPPIDGNYLMGLDLENLKYVKRTFEMLAEQNASTDKGQQYRFNANAVGAMIKRQEQE